METPVFFVFLFTLKVHGCRAMQQSSRALGAHRQPRAMPHAGHNNCVPVWRSSILWWRSGVPPSWIYPQTGARATKSIAPRSETPIDRLDVVTQTSQRAGLNCRQRWDAEVLQATICSSLGEKCGDRYNTDAAPLLWLLTSCFGLLCCWLTLQ